MFKNIAVLLFGVFLSVGASADGTLRLVMKNSWSFNELKLVEQGGVITGSMKGLGGEIPIQMSYQKDMITLEWMSTKTYIHVRRWDTSVYLNAYFNQRWLDMDAALDKKTQSWSFWGKSEETGQEAINYKGTANLARGETYIEWEDQLILLNLTPSKGVGTFEGKIKDSGAGGSDKMTIFGESSGSLQDAFFTNPDLIYTWLVGYFI